MPLIEERRVPLSGGCILYDAARVRKADGELFDLAYWSAKGGVERMLGGRGSIAIIRFDGQQWVLRHYQRGGLVAKVSNDHYWWTGEARTRSFAEWRLLAQLYRWDLPVPPPIAARYVRNGWTYTADLITAFVPNMVTLANALLQSGVNADQWRQIGSTIAAFHARGVHHADLNAHNILLRFGDDALPPAPSPSRGTSCWSQPPVFLLDFDRGRIRERGAWEQNVLKRLRHSLEKISIQAGLSFDESHWAWMREGYEERG
jgi:3-deoxy-D-manno-octulosonic acid kinase